MKPIGTDAGRFGILAVVLAGCSALPPPVSHTARWWDAPIEVEATPASLEAPCDVSVHEGEPAVPFDWIGLVEVQDPGPHKNLDRAIESAKMEACRLGGDGLVLLHRADSRRPGIVRPPPKGKVLPEIVLRAAVIRRR